ncbi:MAG: hypothetical protein OEZ36_12375 [Spirochaetota bacterium]|nr:hypothetical protein [Spirochaetota bacterium]
MAIILEGCDGAPVIWGKLGEFVIQRTKRGTMYIRRWVKPANPQTVKQQANRLAFREGIARWSSFEGLYHKEYWDETAKNHGFRDGYRAFLSSYMILYKKKIAELSGEAEALNWVRDVAKPILYEASPVREMGIKVNNDLILAVMKQRSGRLFQERLRASLDYLRGLGWLDRIRYGLLPLADSLREWDIARLGLLRV